MLPIIQLQDFFTNLFSKFCRYMHYFCDHTHIPLTLPFPKEESKVEMPR